MALFGNNNKKPEKFKNKNRGINRYRKAKK